MAKQIVVTGRCRVEETVYDVGTFTLADSTADKVIASGFGVFVANVSDDWNRFLTQGEILQLGQNQLLSVINRTTNTRPVSPSEGARYLIPAGQSAGWPGAQDHQIAVYNSGIWTYFTPKIGWIAHDQANGAATYLFTGSTWTLMSSGGGSTSPGGSSGQLQYNNGTTFGGISGASSDGANVTFGSGNLRATAPVFSNSINDQNGNVLLAINPVAGSVNQFRVSNAATGGQPKIDVSGSDTNISLKLAAKGNGRIISDSHVLIADSVNGSKINFGGLTSADVLLEQTGGTGLRVRTGDGSDHGVFNAGYTGAQYSFIGGVSSPSQITGNQNNYSPARATIHRLNTSGAFNLTGLDLFQGDGEFGFIINSGSNALTLKHQDTNSTTTNRFLSVTGSDVVLSANEIAFRIFDGTTGRFRIAKLGASGGASVNPTSGVLPFNNAGTFADSLASQSGGTLTVTGNLTTTGAITTSRTTTSAAAELNATKIYNNSIVETGIPVLMSLNMTIGSTANYLSAQPLRYIYTRTNTATGLPTAGFDAMANFTPVVDSNFGAVLYGLNFDGLIGSGTVTTYARININSTSNATNNYSILVQPGGGLAGFGTGSPTAQLHVVSGDATRIGLQVNGAASATAPLLDLQLGATPGSGGDALRVRNSAGTANYTFQKVSSTGVANGLKIESDTGVFFLDALQITSRGYNSTTTFRQGEGFTIIAPSLAAGSVAIGSISNTALFKFNNIDYGSTLPAFQLRSSVAARTVLELSTSTSPSVPALQIKMGATPASGGHILNALDSASAEIFRVSSDGQKIYLGGTASTNSLILNAAGATQVKYGDNSALGVLWTGDFYVDRTYQGLERTFTPSTQQNNFQVTPSPATFVFINPGAANVNITGFDATQYVSGTFFFIVNSDPSTDTVTLVHNSASSSAGNKIFCNGGANIVLQPKEFARVIYSTNISGFLVSK